MVDLVKIRDTCRLCGSASLLRCIPLASVPIVSPNVGLGEGEQAMTRLVAPLDNYLCQDCGLIQLIHVVDPQLIYRKYLYRTSISLGLPEHFKGLARAVIDGLGLESGDRVVEFGSNDGTLLRFFKSEGMKVCGVDPAETIAAEATKNGVPTRADFFGARLAEMLVGEEGAAKAIIANNAMANIDDLDDILRGIKTLLAPEGAFVFETQYALDVFEKTLLDVIYHEHLSCFSVRPVAQALKRFDLELFDADRIPTKGGSIRFWVQHKGGPRPVSDRVAELTALETATGLYDPDYLARFGEKISCIKAQLHELIERKKKQGPIAGYGTSVGSAALIHQFELEDKLDLLLDDMPFKDRLEGPGYNLPVIKGAAINDHRPALVVILAWRYADGIVGKHGKYLENGGEFVVPLPDISTVSLARDSKNAKGASSKDTSAGLGHLGYYKEHGISPVKYDIRDLTAHFDRRDSLYRGLGLPPVAFKGCRVLEVAPGSGQNSLYVASTQPAVYDLVEPNPTATADIAAAYADFSVLHTTPHLNAVRLEEFSPAQGYDIVICENWLSAVPNERLLIRKLADMLVPGGILVLTFTPLTGFFPNVLRRLFALRLTRSDMPFAEQTAFLAEVFGTHLTTIRDMTRSYEHWVQDCMLNPHYLTVALPLDVVLEEIGATSEILSSVPHFVSDWRWFKSQTGQERQFNEGFRRGYFENLHNFIDYRRTFAPRPAEDNLALDAACIGLHVAALSWQAAHRGGNDNRGNFDQITAALDVLVEELSKVDDVFESALREARDAWIEPTIDPARVRDMEHFGALFGRETVYLSSTRIR